MDNNEQDGVKGRVNSGKARMSLLTQEERKTLGKDSSREPMGDRWAERCGT